MHDAIAQLDRAAIISLLDQLKSSSNTLGARQIEYLCDAMEVQADVSDMAPILQSLESAFERVRAAFKRQ